MQLAGKASWRLATTGLENGRKPKQNLPFYELFILCPLHSPDRYGHFTNQTGEESAQMLHGPMGGGGRGDSRYRIRWNERKKGEEAKERMEEIYTGDQVTGTGIL
jgi:hypothetical protein